MFYARCFLGRVGVDRKTQGMTRCDQLNHYRLYKASQFSRADGTFIWSFISFIDHRETALAARY
jgi:hypothetical protein